MMVMVMVMMVKIRKLLLDDDDDSDDDDDKIFPGGLEKTCPSVKTHAIFHFPPHPPNNN